MKRAREIGIPFEGRPGRWNALTDVSGVEVGHATIVRGSGDLVVGKGPVRTGVTAILTRGRNQIAPVLAAWFSLNDNGEMTGTAWIDESGMIEGPNQSSTRATGIVSGKMFADQEMDDLFEGTEQAMEEAIVNALVAARTMTGADGFTAEAIDHERLKAILTKYNRLTPSDNRR